MQEMVMFLALQLSTFYDLLIIKHLQIHQRYLNDCSSTKIKKNVLTDGLQPQKTLKFHCVPKVRFLYRVRMKYHSKEFANLSSWGPHNELCIATSSPE